MSYRRALDLDSDPVRLAISNTIRDIMQADDPADAAVKDGGATLHQQPGHDGVVTSKQARVLLPTDDGTHQLKTAEHKPAPVEDGQDTDEEQDEKEEEEDGDAEDTDYLADFPDETPVCGLLRHLLHADWIVYNAQELDLIHCRLKLLDELHLERFAASLRRLCLRQNAISKLNPETFHQLTKLEEVDFYDNKLKDVGDAFDKLSVVTSLDLSFNLLKSVPERLHLLTTLSTLYFVQNRISKISGLSTLTNLRSLELGGNRIRKIENLGTLVNLEEIWLGKNKITKLEGLGTLKKLKILSIQSNRITKLEGLEALEDLDQLYLSHNGIKQIEGLERNLKLTTLDIQYNFIEKLENVSHLTQLEEFWMSGNKIPDLTGLDKELRQIETLRTLYLEANPCQTNDMANYRRKVMLTLPQLTQIDATKAKAKGISTSSFFDLKAELSKQEAEFTKNKAAGNSTTIVGGVKRPDKKPTVWARQNKGVAARASRDVELEAISKPTLESARAVLERKAKIYEKLKKGRSGGLSEAQFNSLLVDFDAAGQSNNYESDSDDVDESLTVPQGPDDERDPIIEYEDEFGRVRTARRSEIPRHLLPKEQQEPDSDEDIVIYNPEGHFPVYVPSEERMQEIDKKYAEENNPLAVHYDSTRENRAKGAGFYQFSADEETRKAQMEELKASRMETEKARQEAGAMDVRPGEVGGMRDGEDGSKAAGPSRAMEKRKRELEERRKLIEAKRRKVQPKANEQPAAASTHATATKVEPAQPGPVEPIDPFAALEAVMSTSQTVTGGSKGKTKAAPTDEADDFLSKLEAEFMASKGKKKHG
ncbi:hypothetical protein EST38_g4801 [Candolleomyces aberdarensis]|uniref:U2A'/phosphoprotein 32 family A C-terminal domain-containing protein n=1 Tax=Candolleomyces aberdarensis TaxID=2316362 RepID=A0A4Q2DM14_9AGAR|nr:hypothetical protein EST38_g4801 [Candolleomyces aberdarensis]